ncbi:growth-regulating factor 4-like [Dorcoceras hygrometricum]|uniref:Growth-regulating factor n=1 Tax=Dorcoceras hygrometricum TaxID=472368 RepID=A0A2Z7AYR2_9LAMI|nr:growth-regulating factor 4-like [Dorcoceras hygrometricum]
MSGTTSTSTAVRVGGGAELGYGGYRPPFTAMQWQELEHQAMIYKYLVAGLPIPPDLVMPIRRSFESISASLFHHPSLGYCSYYGKKFDPEPGRCRRTDGKKWRCSKDAHPDSKYCERHMHRSSSSSFQNRPFYSAVNSNESSLGSNLTKLQMESMPYGINNKEFRYIHGLNPDSSDNSFSAEASGSVGNLGLGPSSGCSNWQFIPSQVSSNPYLKQKPDSPFMGESSSQQNMLRGFEPIGSTMPKQLPKDSFFGNESSSAGPVQHEQLPVHPFFNEWPTTKESWPNFSDDVSSKNFFSSTQLSISIPRASRDVSPRSDYSPKG